MWKPTLAAAQSALNNTQVKRLNDQCPMKLFTAHEQDTPLGVMVTRTNNISTFHNISEARTDAIINLIQFNDILSEMHRQCADSNSRRRKAAVRIHNQKTVVRPVDFGTGDFVLKGEARSGNNLQLRWRGPFKVINCKCDYMFEVEDLMSHNRHKVHGHSLKFFLYQDY